MAKSVSRSRIELQLYAWFVVLVVAAVTGVATVGIRNDDQRYDELFKFFLTLLQVGGIGGLATLLLERYRQQDAARKDLDKYRRQMFLDARKAYDQIKRIRRLLQDLLGIKHPNPSQLIGANTNPALLRRYGSRLIEPQLALESLKEQAYHSPQISGFRDLSSQFRTMEEKANHVSDALRSAPAFGLQGAQYVCDFLNTAKFRAGFSHPYREAIRILLDADR